VGKEFSRRVYAAALAVARSVRSAAATSGPSCDHPQHTRSRDVGIASQRLPDKRNKRIGLAWTKAYNVGSSLCEQRPADRDATWMSAPQLKQEEAAKVTTLNGFAEVT
jgi:hypothetical protein